MRDGAEYRACSGQGSSGVVWSLGVRVSELSYHEDPPADWLLRIPEGGEELVARLGIGGGRIFCSGEGTHFIFLGWREEFHIMRTQAPSVFSWWDDSFLHEIGA
jgi:hypothetical protein